MGASAKSKQNSVSTYAPTAQAGAAYTDVLGKATTAANNLTYDPATGKTIAAQTDPQLQAFQNIANNQGIWQPGVDAGAATVNSAAQGIGAADISQFYNPYQQDVIDATMQDVGQNNAMAQRAYTANEAAQSGLGGNGYFVGKAQLTGQQGRNDASTLANLRSTGFNTALSAAQAQKAQQLAAGQAQAQIGGQTAQLAASDASQLLASGNQQQQQQQNVNDAASQNATNEQLLPLQAQQYAAGIAGALGPLMGGTTTTNGTATQSQGKGAGSVVGPALSTVSMLSDERAKENIEEVGKTHDGQPIYSYRYKGDPRTQMGLLAQNVERGDHPEAVTQGIGGMKMVNYDRALANAKGYADGGGVKGFEGFNDGLMGWQPLHAAQPIIPQSSSVAAPAMAQEAAFDPQASWDAGKKAKAGLSDLFGGGVPVGPAASSPAGGAMAASSFETPALASGSGGIMSGLSSLFGFADGGMVPSEEELRAIEMQESGGRHDTVSSAGARGVMQIMPATGRDPGYGVTPLRDSSETENRRFGKDYYAAMLNKYGGDRDAAMIAYNGGPARADAWLKAGRDDKVIPSESANYYKQVQGRMNSDLGATTQTSTDGTRERIMGALERDPQPTSTTATARYIAPLIDKGTLPAGEGGQPYQSKADKKTGGLLNRVFGIEFNPLNLDENERRALLVAGLSMWSSGDIGKGGLAGMQYLTNAETGEREANSAAAALQRTMNKDSADLTLRLRAEDRQETKDAEDRTWREGESARKAAELTTDQKEYEAAKKDGYDKSFIDFQLDQKRAANPSASIPAEVGARIEMGRNFIRQVPDIEARITKLDAADRINLSLGRGAAAGLWRDIETGRDALLRGLTGAGMSISEAQNAVDRYQISSTDQTDTMLSKVRSLQRDLEAVERGAITGKSGMMAKQYGPETPTAEVTAPRPLARPKAAPVAGDVVRGYRFKGGDPSAQGSWEAVQ